ncbi:hypothetical protein [uncultured Cohaesibacter sp.]|uniref:polysaccharide deacetylase family protein n=1 Tax=uncultured Cohaesibacter sp. TaxID=1002546 RepID=UPI00292FEC8C|nr:hypothetical protein [uncultured Cohaesibacter sp.]
MREVVLQALVLFIRVTVIVAGMAGSCFAQSSIAPSAKAERFEPFVKRTVLALYDSRDEKEPVDTNIHAYLEMPLNYLGYEVDYHDIQQGLPSVDEMRDKKAVVTWFHRSLVNWKDYLIWAEECIRGGTQFVVFSQVGGIDSQESKKLTNRFLAQLGLKNHFSFLFDTSDAGYEVIDRKIYAFEREPFRVLPNFDYFEAISPETRIHLSVHFADQTGLKQSALITTNANGAFVHSGYEFDYEASVNLMQWLLNPFELFETVLGRHAFPIPDTTTLYGNRIYFSHVDGDGWNNVSFMEKYKKDRVFSSKVMLEELIKPYPGLPVSIGLVTGDFDKAIGGTDDGLEIAREILAQPQVEVASHTHTHPFDWNFFENYDREKELALLKKKNEESSSAPTGVIGSVETILNRISPDVKTDNYILDGLKGALRAYLRFPFDLDTEIKGSLDFATQQAPKGKKAEILFWSGNTRPFEAAIRASRLAGVRNLNGGDSRYDLSNPSVIYVPALSRVIGDQRQIYAAASNEETFTNNWKGPFYGFAALEETLKNTEFPRRLKPFNVYYHSFSGERANAIKAIQTHLDLARDGPYFPLTASHYAAIADSFFEARIEKLGSMRWAIHDRDFLQTLRFDHADELGVDWLNSKGVIGQNRHAGSLYVALDASVAVPVLAIMKRDDANQVVASVPFLESSRWEVRNVNHSDCDTGECKLTFEANGFGRGEMLWKGLPKGCYRVVAHWSEGAFDQQISVGEDHLLSVTLPFASQRTVSVEIHSLLKPDRAMPAREKVAG